MFRSKLLENAREIFHQVVFHFRAFFIFHQVVFSTPELCHFSPGCFSLESFFLSFFTRSFFSLQSSVIFHQLDFSLQSFVKISEMDGYVKVHLLASAEIRKIAARFEMA